MRLEDWSDDQCVWCGREYAAKQIWQKYCSTACKEESRLAFNKQVRQSQIDALRCQYCGEPMPHAQRTDRQFCSKPCRRKAETIRKNGGTLVELVRCVDCGDPIPEAVRVDTKLCAGCARMRRRESAKLRQRRLRAGAPSGYRRTS